MRFEAALTQAKEWGVKLRYGVDPWLKIVPSMKVNSTYSELHAWNEAIGKWEPYTIKVEHALGDRWETEPKPKEFRKAWMHLLTGEDRFHVVFTTGSVPESVTGGWERAPWLDEPPGKIDAPTKPESVK